MSKDGNLVDDFKRRMTESKWSFYIGSSLLGLARTTIGFPMEHPLDSIKTQW